MLTTVAVPTDALVVSFVAVGTVLRVSVLSGFPSPSVSGFKGSVPPETSAPLVRPSLSQSKAAQVE